MYIHMYMYMYMCVPICVCTYIYMHRELYVWVCAPKLWPMAHAIQPHGALGRSIAVRARRIVEPLDGRSLCVHAGYSVVGTRLLSCSSGDFTQRVQIPNYYGLTEKP